MASKKYTNAQVKEGLSGLNKKIGEQEDRKSYLNHRSGIAGREIIEPIPRFNKARTEVVLSNKHNSWIVLGRDRPGSKASGYGGIGHTHCAAIDLVAGRMSYMAVDTITDTGNRKRSKKVLVDPSFRLDAARIYICQKSNVDKDFELPKGKLPFATARSAVAMKADGIRLVAREGIKLVAGHDRTNSQGGDITRSGFGINLMGGGHGNDMQPIVKGQNLEACLQGIVRRISKLGGVLDTFLMSQIALNAALMTHSHVAPLVGPTTPSFDLAPSVIKALVELLIYSKRGAFFEKINIEVLDKKYLSPFGKGYINSVYNYTN
jgi:hypothetical protein|tara:strand:+ start:3305 stop:4264 length:960 start_codon:yes stop_codon:yes gene_type:complete